MRLSLDEKRYSQFIFNLMCQKLLIICTIIYLFFYLLNETFSTKKSMFPIAIIKELKISNL